MTEHIIVVIPTLIYYKSIFENTVRIKLSRDPAFLEMTGTLFGFVVPIPIYAYGFILLATDKTNYLYLYTFNSIGYILLHIFLIKAYMVTK